MSRSRTFKHVAHVCDAVVVATPYAEKLTSQHVQTCAMPYQVVVPRSVRYLEKVRRRERPEGTVAIISRLSFSVRFFNLGSLWPKSTYSA